MSADQDRSEVERLTAEVEQLRPRLLELSLLLHNNQVRAETVEEHHGDLLRRNADLQAQVAELTRGPRSMRVQLLLREVIALRAQVERAERVIEAVREWLAALDATEDEGEDDRSLDAGHAVSKALAAYDAGLTKSSGMPDNVPPETKVDVDSPEVRPTSGRGGHS